MSRSTPSQDRLETLLRQAVIAALACAVLLPFAHAPSAAFGWLPLWLVGLPLASWLGLGLSRRAGLPAVAASARPRRRAAAVKWRRGELRRRKPGAARLHSA
ncbi:hypothetical protein EBB59_07545 [Lysobacter pythonis]|uniref:Transmembrane protein n=1 Tax=Solilutibacter pythonis TaxID=2483112 RepID=A0A3M2HYA1_9GAMM|nr:hypothetical protein [Lysobacter pythonis]RMH92813.1 hypothetical protein EBB59_07545 [Lysobacter pythonis]